MRCQETYFTAAGPVQVLRTLYKNRGEDGERAISPMELRLGVVEGRWTPLAVQQAVWVVAQLTPLRAEELFARIGNMTPSKSSLDRLPKAMSARWEQERVEFEKALRDGDVIPQHAVTVAVSLDGVLAPMRDGDAQKKREKTAEEGRLTRGPAEYREVGCGTLSFCDAEGDMISAVRIARMPETKKATLKRTLLSDVTAALAERPELRLVKIADGALDNWTFLANEAPGGVEILDFYHAVEHLDGALGSVYGEGTIEARKRFTALRFELQEEADGAEKVIRALDYLRKKHPTNTRVTKELAYFRNNRHRMRYQEFAAAGLPIGSGVVEAACKTLVTQRMKQSGMRWDEAGGQAILTVRGWMQSGDRFDRAWALLAATYQAEVVVLHNVVPFPPGGRQKHRCATSERGLHPVVLNGLEASLGALSDESHSGAVAVSESSRRIGQARDSIRLSSAPVLTEQASRTALLVAAYRVPVSAKLDLMCDDPWAAALAGDQGLALAEVHDRAYPPMEL